MQATAEGMTAEELQGKFIVGEFVDIKKPTLDELYDDMEKKISEANIEINADDVK